MRKTSSIRTVDALVPEDLIPLPALRLRIFHPQVKQPPVPRIRQEEARPILGHDYLSGGIRLLSAWSALMAG